jgi:hypothetical protein
MAWKRVQPRQVVIHLGGYFLGFFMSPPARANSIQNSRTAYAFGRPH